MFAVLETDRLFSLGLSLVHITARLRSCLDFSLIALTLDENKAAQKETCK